MALSTSQTLPTQETGTIAADKPYFGPPRHEYHDTKNWIMTTSKSTAKEILLNPEAKDRRRQINTPAFLRPAPAGHRLPGLIKTLHAIPAAREALLSRNCISDDYGHHSEWWDGVPIESPRVLHAEVDFQTQTPNKEVIYEGQRLMAFLDDTDRAYGSSEALLNLSGIREYQGDMVVQGFITTWEAAATHYNSAASLCNLFQSRGTKVSQGGDSSQDVNILEVDLNEQHVEPGHTLYDAIDALLWPGWQGNEHGEQVFLDHVADVLIIRIARGGDPAKGLDIKVPPVWYSDRYRQPNQPRVQQMLASKAAIKREIEQLNSRKQKASEFNGLNHQGKSMDVSQLLEITRQHFEKSVEYGEDAKQTQEEATGKVPDLDAYSKVAEELKVLSDRVAGKLQMFEESKELARDRLRELSKLFTEPSDIPAESPRDRYTLRGVCANSHTVYVQERNPSASEDKLVDVGAEEEWQWWKLSYDASATQPVSCARVREVEVLKAARNEAASAFLVYASDRAMAVENQELPPPLKLFVQADNRAFAAELASSTSPPPRANSNNPFLQFTNESAFRGPTSRDLPPDDQELPPYNDHQRPFPTPARDKSYDDFIPVCLRQDDMDVDERVEMMERGGTGTFGGGNGQGNGDGGYRLGSYMPDIRMEDDEEEETGQRGREG
ncbi:MAG: hypothetical protein L6R39_002029 [Caloplaca ligustica]|nr:MAG: hypothetical protein L6R39_002029 [Caloplaca ligustica]